MTPAAWDRNGKPIDVETFARLTSDLEYKRLIQTRLPNGKWISTVWLGLDHSADGGPPLIFETVAFAEGPDPLGESLDRAHYATEADARAGHEEMIRKWSTLQ